MDTKQWTRKPIRNLHITVREPDIIDLDVGRFVETLVDLKCNFVTLLTGGCHCFYQSQIPLNRINPYLGDRDILGELVDGVHRHDIKIGACVDVMMQRQPEKGRIMVHLVNLTGKRSHSECIPIRDIEVEVRWPNKHPPGKALLATTGDVIPFECKKNVAKLSIDELELYDVIVLEP